MSSDGGARALRFSLGFWRRSSDRRTFARKARKRGVVVAISGGIDSSVTSALCVRAFGAGKVFGLLLPEYDSSSDSLKLGKIVAEHHGIEYQVQPIGATLEAIGCYQARDDAIRAAIPAYQSGWRHKLVISGGQQGMVNHFKIVVEKPDGSQITATLGLKEYLQIVAAKPVGPVGQLGARLVQHEIR